MHQCVNDAFFLYRSPEERIACELEVAAEYLVNNLPDYCIQQVPRDGSCLIRAVLVGLHDIGQRDATLDVVKSSLEVEITARKGFYQEFSKEDVDVVEEVKRYIENPLSKYHKDTTDLYLTALGSWFEVNIVVIQSSITNCTVLNLGREDNQTFPQTLYFLKTFSEHLDAVVKISHSPTTLYEDDLTGLAHDEDLTQQVEILEEYERDYENSVDQDVGDRRFIDFTRHPPVHMNTDDGSSTEPPITYEKETAVHINADNGSNNEEPPINYEKPTAEELFRVVLEQPELYERERHL